MSIGKPKGPTECKDLTKWVKNVWIIWFGQPMKDEAIWCVKKFRRMNKPQKKDDKFCFGYEF